MFRLCNQRFGHWFRMAFYAKFANPSSHFGRIESYRPLIDWVCELVNLIGTVVYLNTGKSIVGAQLYG